MCRPEGRHPVEKFTAVEYGSQPQVSAARRVESQWYDSALSASFGQDLSIGPGSADPSLGGPEFPDWTVAHSIGPAVSVFLYRELSAGLGSAGQERDDSGFRVLSLVLPADPVVSDSSEQV